MAPKAKAQAKGNERFIKKQSTVAATDAGGTVMKGFYVWCHTAPAVKEEPDLLFAKCLVLPGSTNEQFKLKQVDPPGHDQEFVVTQNDVFNFNSNIDPMGFPDIGMLPHTNVPCVLDYIKCRYIKGQIYCTADPLLVAVNPFKNLGNATDEWIIRYRDAPDVGKLGPHCFTTARTALENLHAVNKSQTIIVSGESGAGKTEATKMIMRFFASAKSGTLDTRIQKAVMAANPVLEAFGNAKTIRNNNSSRFGRFMQLQVVKGGGIEYGSVRNFLLEKSRIISQEPDERSYHVFYFLVKGASSAQQKEYKLLPLKDYRLINVHCLDAPGIDDIEEFKLMDDSFDSMLMTPQEKTQIYKLVSGVLLLGNVKLRAEPKDGVPDAGVIDPSSRQTLKDACELLALDAAQVEEGITIKVSVAGGQLVRGRWRLPDAEMLRDSLSKAVYDKLFDWIVKKLNTNIEPESWNSFLGMLDIFGFEVFLNNSLEQLFINITNEMLQKNFTDVVFDREQKLYKSEGISAADLIFTSNKEVIDCLTAKKKSLMTCLEDLCLAPGGTDEKFLSAAWTTLKDSPKFIKPKVGGNTSFIVCHTIGDIQYSVHGFIFKNKDVLRPELIEVLQASNNPVTAALFEGVVVERGKSSKGQLIGSQFLAQLEALMNLINQTEPHFIRCVKPNETKKALEWNAAKVLVQLHSLSILEALQLRNLGYSYRRVFSDFLQQFKFIDLGIAENTSLSEEERCKEMVKRAKLEKGVAMGKTMVFMKPEASKEMARLQRRCMADWEPLVGLIEAMYKLHSARQAYKNKESPLLRLQALSRRKLHGKVPPPKFSETISAIPPAVTAV